MLPRVACCNGRVAVIIGVVGRRRTGKGDPDAKREHQGDTRVKRPIPRRTCRQAERGAADGRSGSADCGPDADAVSLSEALGTSVSVLLGETVSEPKADDLRSIAEKLEVINLQLARRRMTRRKVLLGLFAAIFVVTLLTLACLLAMGSPYQTWTTAIPRRRSSAPCSMRRVGLRQGVAVLARWLGRRVLPVLRRGGAA